MLKQNQLFSTKNDRNTRLHLTTAVSLVLLSAMLILPPKTLANSNDPTRYWDIESVDTMKYSRDMAASELNNSDFDGVIGTQVRNIKSSGANYVAIGTPYDPKYLPFLKRWVAEARKNNLHVWFRGNFSAWEGWFGVNRGMSTEDHTQRVVDFITQNPDLFEDGDIFSSCPECENGSFGDPRENNRVDDYRKFIISETEATSKAFQQINKKVATNYWSMNLDVAKLVMDRDTAQKVGVVVIDHYVSDPKKLIADANDISEKTGVPVVLGEFGAPIPDLNGNMNQQQQADWIKSALDEGTYSGSISGLNYWVGVGGSTSIWDDSNNPKPAVSVLYNYFNPNAESGLVLDEFGDPIEDVSIKSGPKTVKTGKDGKFSVIKQNPNHLTFFKDEYETLDTEFPPEGDIKVTLIKTNKSLIDIVRLWVKNSFNIQLT
jgi:hypothetical protein